MLVAALVLLVLLGSGTVAGTLFAVARAVVPTLVALPGERYVQVHQLLDRRFDPFFPNVTRVTMAAVLALVLLPATGWPARSWLLAGLAATVLVAVVSDTRNVPINKRIQDWDPDDRPAEWDALRERWCRAHRVRTVFAVAAFAAYATAALQV
jgi:uncharacterized membrane protein